MGPQADVIYVRVRAAVFYEQVGYALYRQGACLTDVVRVVQLSGTYDLIELKGFVNELNRGNQHFLRLAGSPHRSSRSKMLVSIAPELLYIQML